MALKESVLQEISHLDLNELQEVASYLAFLRNKSRFIPSIPDDITLARLYAEFAEEDRELAEAGMVDYASALAKEDAA